MSKLYYRYENTDRFYDRDLKDCIDDDDDDDD
jgi:hypothetical protein